MRNIRSLFLTAAAFVLVFTISSLAQVKDPTDQVTLEKKIEKQLRKLPYYGVYDFISFEVDGSTVTLNGKVANAINRNHAESYVLDLDGVSEVVNNIDVLPPSSFDDTIRRRTVRSFLNSGSIYRYLQGPNPSMRIIVENGRITLEGVVRTSGDYDLANILANSVPGVFKVTNHLKIEPS